MSDIDLLRTWSDSAGVSLLIWIVIIVLALYLGRSTAHQLISSVSRMVYAAMRITARSLSRLERNLARRNKAVLLATGKENVERTIEREFHRINAIVERDLAGYPALHRQISDAIAKIEGDYRNAADSPPLPPAWLDAVNSIAAIPQTGDSTVTRILEDLKKTLERARADTLNEYKKAGLQRHKLLKEMQPSWRKISQSIGQIKNTVDSIGQRSKYIDQQMRTYEQIRAGDEEVTGMLATSSLTQFFISGIVLIIAILGGIINFQLIAHPMSEMVGGTSQLGPMRTADVAALVIIMIEVAMGLFLMESLRITRMFPIIGAMDDTMRKRMIVVTLSILTILAGVEASLAYMRDLLALDREALSQSLAGIAATEEEFRWIPSIGQMIMGFILPFALAFVAIPLESFIHASRTVIGVVTNGILRVTAFVLRLLGNLAQHLGAVFINVYDMIILVPLSIERMIAERRARAREDDDEIPMTKNNYLND